MVLQKVALRLIGFCALSFVASCATVSPPNEPDVVDITIKRVSEDKWHVRLDAGESIDALSFGPTVADYRETSWRLEHGFELHVDQYGHELIQREDKTPFHTVEFNVQSFDQNVPKNYVPFNTFSDSGVSFYTGFFVPSVITRGESKTKQARFSIRPRPGEKVILSGSVYDEVKQWTAPLNEHAFVYVGTTSPVESDDLVAVFDPALPSWLKQHFETKLPEVFAYLSQRLERQLETRAAIFVSAIFDPDTAGYSYKGGTQPSQIQFRLRGQPIDEPNERLQHFFDKFFAHEGAHLWQNLNRSQNEAAWIHEGAAEAIAVTAVRDLEMWDRKSVDAAIANAKEECITGLATTALKDAGEAGAFNLYYSCGLMIARATELSLQTRDADLDIIDFHRVFMAKTEVTDSPYTLNMYLKVFADLGGDAETAAHIKELVETRLKDPALTVGAMLGAPGLP